MNQKVFYLCNSFHLNSHYYFSKLHISYILSDSVCLWKQIILVKKRFWEKEKKTLHSVSLLIPLWLFNTCTKVLFLSHSHSHTYKHTHIHSLSLRLSLTQNIKYFYDLWNYSLVHILGANRIAEPNEKNWVSSEFAGFSFFPFFPRVGFQYG